MTVPTREPTGPIAEPSTVESVDGSTLHRCRPPLTALFVTDVVVEPDVVVAAVVVLSTWI
ncbi:MAG: hypothetical protein ACR2ME_04620 [Acidimicrobiia bacterium]